MQFAVALSKTVETESAARAAAEDILAQLSAARVDLACVFFSAHHAAGADLLAHVLTRMLRPSLLIGCSGEGVIAGAEELETAPAITVWAAVLPDVDLHPLQSSFSATHDQFHLSGWPEPGVEDSSFLLLADPFTVPVQDILGIVEERYPGTKAVGGLTGGGQEAGMNRLILNDQVLDSGLVGVRLSGAVDIRPVISQGCRLIGDRFVVTKADRNLIHELGGAPALERLQAVFESLAEEDRGRAHRALHLGIVIDEHRNRFERGDFLIRNLLGADRTTGAVAIGDVVQEGQTVQFHLRDAESATEDLNSLLATDRAGHRHPPLGALMFSCCGRGRGLFGRPNHDVAVTMERLGPIPIAGFFAQGEIGPIGNRNFLHGYTASLALFAERDFQPFHS
ncbi:MAG: FIST C-terminal domain-containing protein [Nitrospira sp.]|nr:FIST C-terminal domain-containing protein [Nitrospira sp.]